MVRARLSCQSSPRDIYGAIGAGAIDFVHGVTNFLDGWRGKSKGPGHDCPSPFLSAPNAAETWSGREDSNLRPLRPERWGLPSAKFRTNFYGK